MTGWLFFLCAVCVSALYYVDAPDSWVGKTWNRFNTGKHGFRKLDDELLRAVAIISILIIMLLMAMSLVNDFSS